jgi:hypothetical protein
LGLCQSRTGADVGDQVVDLLVGQRLGEQARPVRLHGDAGSLEHLLQLLGGHLLAVVVQQQRRVRASQLSGRHGASEAAHEVP